MNIWTVQDWTNIISASATVLATIVAVWGITAWRHQHVGQRRMEVAEMWLRLTYEAVDVISSIRSIDFMGPSEYADRQREDGEKFTYQRDVAYGVLQRFNAPVPTRLFVRLRALRYRVQALFGKEACAPLENLSSIRSTIIARCKALPRRKPLTEEVVATIMMVISEGEDPEKDEIEARVKIVVSETEKICRPILMQSA